MSDDKPDWWTTDHWATPPHVFAVISKHWGPFDLDACATEGNTKCLQWFTAEQDGLAQRWYGTVWVNPPYSKPAPWIAKAITSVQLGEARRVVMLLPADISTDWFHDLVLPFADVVPVRGRVRFLGWRGTPIGTPKAGSVIAIFPKTPASFSVRPSAFLAHQLSLIDDTWPASV